VCGAKQKRLEFWGKTGEFFEKEKQRCKRLISHKKGVTKQGESFVPCGSGSIGHWIMISDYLCTKKIEDVE